MRKAYIEGYRGDTTRVCLGYKKNFRSVSEELHYGFIGASEYYTEFYESFDGFQEEFR